MGVDSLVLEGKQIGILVVVKLSRVIVFVVTGVRILQILLEGSILAVVVVKVHA